MSYIGARPFSLDALYTTALSSELGVLLHLVASTKLLDLFYIMVVDAKVNGLRSTLVIRPTLKHSALFNVSLHLLPQIHCSIIRGGLSGF